MTHVQSLTEKLLRAYMAGDGDEFEAALSELSVLAERGLEADTQAEKLRIQTLMHQADLDQRGVVEKNLKAAEARVSELEHELDEARKALRAVAPSITEALDRGSELEHALEWIAGEHGSVDEGVLSVARAALRSSGDSKGVSESGVST